MMSLLLGSSTSTGVRPRAWATLMSSSSMAVLKAKFLLKRGQRVLSQILTMASFPFTEWMLWRL